ncbi:hypothetical protein [Flaviaesturariibacter amylovorans]|uniref:Uncharacterized protein n=1 Tax=Flaviaesturariibacter amylovorans TaxID=1084520 RepID=A0ABP8HG67_9BACT
MAELLVQRKKKSALPWILLALIILGIIGYLLWRNQQGAASAAPVGDTTTTTTTTTTGTTTNP